MKSAVIAFSLTVALALPAAARGRPVSVGPPPAVDSAAIRLTPAVLRSLPTPASKPAPVKANGRSAHAHAPPASTMHV